MQNVANRVLLVLVVLGSWSFCLAQGNFLKDIKREGEVISSGNNTTPVGPLKATTYRLEIVRLKEPFQSEHEKPPFEQVFRLTIRVAERLPMEVFSIWIDGRENVAVQVGPKSVAMLIYSRTLPNGVPLALSIQGKKELTSRSVLPETLFVPSEYATPLEDLEARQPVVKLRRLPKTIEIRIEFPGAVLLQTRIIAEQPSRSKVLILAPIGCFLAVAAVTAFTGYHTKSLTGSQTELK